MKIYSGQVSLGICGTPTNIVDDRGNKLHVGDIVQVYSTEDVYRGGLTAVVEDENGQFIMGIKNETKRLGVEWNVHLLKKYSDVINGEKWPDFGFHYEE